MMRLTFIVLALFASSVFAQSEKLPGNKWAYYGQDFYNALSSRHVTKDTLHDILNSAHNKNTGSFDTFSGSCNGGNCYSHYVVGYSNARKIMFGELDKLSDKDGTYIRDVYCGKKFYYQTLSDVSHMGNEVNIEHTWPQSKFTRSYNKEMQKSDMHHLYLTDSKANGVRGNFPFGMKPGQENGGEGCHAFYSYLVDSGRVYTPPAAHRGNVARSLFYFSTRYGMPLDSAQENILRKWHKEDPIDAGELARHAGIVSYEKVRNPFIDHPELVDMVSDF